MGRNKLSKFIRNKTVGLTLNFYYVVNGLETKGIIMIEVEARHIKYWEDNKVGEVVVK